MNNMSNISNMSNQSNIGNNKYFTQLSPSEINKPDSKVIRDLQSQALPSRNLSVFQPAEPQYAGQRERMQHNQPPMHQPVQQPAESTPMSPMAPQTRMPARLPNATPETLVNTAFMPAYLSEQIGKWMRVEFLIGNHLTDRVGRLIEVGASYIVLQLLDPNTTLLCDLFSIKFVTIIDNQDFESLISR